MADGDNEILLFFFFLLFFYYSFIVLLIFFYRFLSFFLLSVLLFFFFPSFSSSSYCITSWVGGGNTKTTNHTRNTPPYPLDSPRVTQTKPTGEKTNTLKSFLTDQVKITQPIHSPSIFLASPTDPFKSRPRNRFKPALEREPKSRSKENGPNHITPRLIQPTTRQYCANVPR
jgi:hypothetical protein